jgi:hypothetical protein
MRDGRRAGSGSVAAAGTNGEDSRDEHVDDGRRAGRGALLYGVFWENRETTGALRAMKWRAKRCRLSGNTKL